MSSETRALGRGNSLKSVFCQWSWNLVRILSSLYNPGKQMVHSLVQLQMKLNSALSSHKALTLFKNTGHLWHLLISFLSSYCQNTKGLLMDEWILMGFMKPAHCPATSRLVCVGGQVYFHPLSLRVWIERGSCFVSISQSWTALLPTSDHTLYKPRAGMRC